MACFCRPMGDGTGDEAIQLRVTHWDWPEATLMDNKKTSSGMIFDSVHPCSSVVAALNARMLGPRTQSCSDGNLPVTHLAAGWWARMALPSSFRKLTNGISGNAFRPAMKALA